MIIRVFRLDRNLLNRGRIIIIQRVRFQDKVGREKRSTAAMVRCQSRQVLQKRCGLRKKRKQFIRMSKLCREYRLPVKDSMALCWFHILCWIR